MYNIAYDKSKKAVIATLSGNISIDEANTMLSYFKKSVAGINAKENILVISPENISASLFVIPILQNFIQLIGQLNFKKIYLINSDKYAGIIKQSLSSYPVGSNVRYADSIKDALSAK